MISEGQNGKLGRQQGVSSETQMTGELGQRIMASDGQNGKLGQQ
jgi:hypothetical protein